MMRLARRWRATYAVEGSLTNPKNPPIVPIGGDNIVGLVGQCGRSRGAPQARGRGRKLSSGALSSRARCFGSSPWAFSTSHMRRQRPVPQGCGHTKVDPDVFTRETPLGTYQGLDEQVYLLKSPGSYQNRTCSAWVVLNRSG